MMNKVEREIIRDLIGAAQEAFHVLTLENDSRPADHCKVMLLSAIERARVMEFEAGRRK
jgi:hypothetical protein